jgi:molybdopterin molybdotransferase
MPDENILDYPSAAALVREHAARLQAPTRRETLPVLESLGRVLGTPVLADRDQPPFDRSTRDGYAVRTEDIGKPLRVVGQLRAGQPPFAGTIGAGEALEIMTGAPMPAGADAVLMVEHADASPTGISAQAGRTLKPGDNVVPAGAEARAGAVILPAGTRLTPMHIGAAVSAGAANVEIYAQPRVAILATGDELVEPGEPLLTHQIRNSNSYSLAAQVMRAGAVPVRLPIVHDNLDALQAAIRQAMEADLILLSGGVSMGKFDFVEQVLAAVDAKFFFTGVRMQPGKPVVFGSLPLNKYFFGLPGNPVSTMVTFALFAAPLIRALGGEHDPQPVFARARLATDFKHQGGTTRFLPALLNAAWDRAEVTPVPWQGSGDLAATARANCFVIIPPDRQMVAAGSEVGVLLAYS